MRKKLQIAVVALFILGMVAVPLTACSKGSTTEQTTTTTQTATVQTGNITTEITASGNLALSQSQDVALDIFYSQATIGEVLVETGDTVTKGQVLVNIDPDEWADELSALEDAITTKQHSLTQAEVSLTNAQDTLADTENTTSLEKAILTAEVNVQTKQSSLDSAMASYNWQGYDAVSSDLTKARAWYNYLCKQFNMTGELDYDELPLTPSQTNGDPRLVLEMALYNLTKAQTAYDNFVAGYDTPTVNSAKLNLDMAKIDLETAKQNLADAPKAVAAQKIQVQLAQDNVDTAQKALDDARKKLAAAQAKSPELVAPFDGFVTAVNVTGGDYVYNGKVAVTVADPSKFEADIMVGETDILNVKLGDTATISVDAIPDVSFPAKVTHISPTATISSSVVNYDVTVEVTSLKAIVTQTAAASPGFPSTSGGTPPANFTPPADFTPPAQGGTPTRPAATTTNATAAAVTEKEYTLKEGMTATVTLTLVLSSNVLLVPSEAIITQSGLSYVEVMLSTGATEQRVITTGQSDDTNTEVTSGLQEGEKVLISSGTASTTKITATATATSTQRNQDGGMFFGGGGPP
jgi:HlyD family secretion protein